ncbi:MAG: 3-oxoacyl-[acyl-carrier-protein] synthase-3, partial [Pirellulaceae bacterium]
MDQPAPQIGNSGRSRMGRLTGVQILATGSYVPEPIVRNEDLAELGYNADWIIQRTGISQRRKADSNTATSDLAYEAAIRCLRQANVGVNDVDMILVATMTPDTPMPSTACYLQKRLGALAPAMDINAACAGFMYAMVTGMQFVATGTCKRVLVVGADVMSRTVDPEDHKTFPLFGDGAGAALLGPGEANQGLLSFTLGSEGDFGEYLCQPAGGSREPTTAASLAEKRQFIQMDGRAVFKWAVRLVADSVQDVLNHANVTAADVDLLVLHQANF